MTLDEAIAQYKQDDSEESKQLTEWLTELKHYRDGKKDIWGAYLLPIGIIVTFFVACFGLTIYMLNSCGGYC